MGAQRALAIQTRVSPRLRVRLQVPGDSPPGLMDSGIKLPFVIKWIWGKVGVKWISGRVAERIVICPAQDESDRSQRIIVG